jgi:hypothetical protein
MSHFRERWSKLPDVRKPNNNTRYSLATGALSAFAVFFMQSASFWRINDLWRRNSQRSANTKPDGSASSNFQEDFWFLLDSLKEQGHWQQFRTELNTYAIPMDGITFFSSEKISCPNCLRREDRSGKVHFYHSAITPVIVKPGKAQVLPLPPEFIVPQDGNKKQDCERMTVKRWLSQHHQHFPDYSVTYLDDDLYASQP